MSMVTPDLSPDRSPRRRAAPALCWAAVLLCSGLSVFGLGCSDKGEGDGDGSLAVGPELEHTPPTGELVEGAALSLDLLATDSDGVRSAVAYHRNTGEEFWDSTPLTGDGDTWTGTVDGLIVPGVDYYFKATDGGDPEATSYLPAEGPEAPFSLAVSPTTQGLPFLEDFEETDVEVSLFTMGWWTPSVGVNTYPWTLNTDRASSGSGSAFHPRGYVGAIEDWLISPALDFRSLDAIMVRWSEYGAATDALEGHALYLSTGSRDPADGGYTLVEAALPAPPEDEWGPSNGYDLSAWAGEPVVYLAWVYTGTDASDDWYIDEVSVGPLVADLDASLLSWSPDPVRPGETTTVTVQITNDSPALADGLSASLTFPDGGASTDGAAVPVVDLDPHTTTEADFSVTIDAAAADNHRLPVELTVTDGEEVWSWDLEMIIGRPSSAVLSLSLTESALTSVSVGQGDPDAPTLELDVLAATLPAGASEVEVDLTDYIDLLPPGPGPDRWFARVQSASEGSLTRLSIDTAGAVSSSTNTVYLPPDTEALIYDPEPPVPALVTISTAPSSVKPGDVVSLSLTVGNNGAASAGPVTATLVSTHADLSVLTPDPITVDGDVWSPGEYHGLSALQVAVSPLHRDSTDLTFQLVFSDGVETWAVDGAFAVPMPVMKIIRVTVIDDGADGILDPDESAELEIEVANVGDAASSGLLAGVLSVEASSTAPATLSADSGSFGLIGVGSSRDQDGFLIDVVGGSAGDTVDLLLTLTDSANTYEARTQLVLGEMPWSTLTTAEDATGDTLGGYGFDFHTGEYRVQSGVVELRLTSAVTFDPNTLFIEAWGSGGASPYTYYIWILQSGATSMRGYDDSGFHDIGALAVDFPDTETVVLSWDTADMAVATNGFSLGFGAGWCGPPEYYCDQFPDGWGYPYDTFSPSDWFSIEW